MVSILWIAIGIAILSAVLGSFIFEFFTNSSSPNALEERCEKIAKEGYQIHTSYPNLQPDQLPSADMRRLMYLDEIWIKDCVSKLPAASIFNIIQKVEHDFFSGE